MLSISTFRIPPQVLAELRDVNIHAPGIEVVVVNPYRFKGKIAFQNLIAVAAEQFEQLRLLGGELLRLVLNVSSCFATSKVNFADCVLYPAAPQCSALMTGGGWLRCGKPAPPSKTVW